MRLRPDHRSGRAGLCLRSGAATGVHAGPRAHLFVFRRGGRLCGALATASTLHGLLTVAAFGAGSGPIMILTGAGGSLISLGARRRLLRIAAICVMIAGLISLARGGMFFQLSGAVPLHSCPFCGPTGE